MNFLKIVAKTDKGRVRSSNQDAYAVGEFPDEVAWAVVCDGMGGVISHRLLQLRLSVIKSTLLTGKI